MVATWEASTAAFVDKMVASMRFDSSDDSEDEDEESPPALPSKINPPAGLVRNRAAMPNHALPGPGIVAATPAASRRAPKHSSRDEGSSGVVAPEDSAEELEGAPPAAGSFTPDRREAPLSRTRQVKKG